MENEIKLLVLFGGFLTSDFPHHEGDILDHAIRHWHEVSWNAKKLFGAHSLPERPTPAFLQRHPRAAVNKWIEDGRPKIKGVEPVQPATAATRQQEPLKDNS